MVVACMCVGGMYVSWYMGGVGCKMGVCCRSVAHSCMFYLL